MLAHVGSACIFFFTSSFEVTCTSTTGAATLTKTRTDTVVPGTPGTYTVNFVEADGVVPGTTYDCSVTMELDGYVSGKSSPVFLTTADDTGQICICFSSPFPNDKFQTLSN